MRFTLLLLFTFLSSITLGQSKKFTINGSVDTSFKADKIYFSQVKLFGSQAPQPRVINIKDGKFVIKGELDEPQQAIISLTEDLRQRETAFRFLIDSGSVKIQVPSNIRASVVSGSKINSTFTRFLQSGSEQQENFHKFYQEVQQASSAGKNQDSLQTLFQERYAKFLEEQQKLKIGFLKDNKNSFVSLLVIKEVAESSQNYNKADSLFQLLAKEVKKTPSGQAIAAEIEAQKMFSVGAVAPNFTQVDTAGKPINLTDFRGKYVLLDFWASWCKPCRDENPNVVAAFNQYKGKGFTVLGVSLDREGAKNAWLKAIADDELAWTHVSDLKFWQNEVARMYNIRSIPQNFLLDPKGKIIAKNLRGAELQSFLANLFSED
ncbi:TlpA disulfide reductase family protein [Pedobacter sp. SYSU D00535]|uniref:TlpA disulfide reductase family protein n=1 Tax=Pedobacter sp. SYSU D00535 TaxID=2810308 RepID=UPI001A95C02D|nr:TlpA disulfide reductase family protein [Pedobacter sp. SYSU D00535]